MYNYLSKVNWIASDSEGRSNPIISPDDTR